MFENLFSVSTIVFSFSAIAVWYFGYLLWRLFHPWYWRLFALIIVWIYLLDDLLEALK